MWRKFVCVLAGLSVVTLIADFSFAAVPSTPYVWRSVRIVAGGFVPGIVFSPAKRGLAYVRTDIGGFYRSDDAGAHWSPLTDWVDADHGNWLGGESVAPDPSDADTVYLAAGMYSGNPAAMLRSHDGGRSWKATEVPIHMGGNEDGRGCGERLAVDPNDPSTLYFGSRYDGLWSSTDGSVTWHKVSSFPSFASGTAGDWKNYGFGIGCVLFDPSSGAKGTGPSRVIFAGVSQPGAPAALYRSGDAGATWQPVPGLPAGLLVHQGAIDSRNRTLYLTLGDTPGPNGVAGGAVVAIDLAGGRVADITPAKPTADHRFGYAGISLDRQHPGTLVVTTADRWYPGDDVFRSTDSGRTWKPVKPTQHIDVSMSPYLNWGNAAPREGWWMDAVAIDPFDSNHCVYGTGATIYGTHELSNVQTGRPTQWDVEANGIEETAAICLTSLPSGPHLVSGLGDIGGFVHDDLSVSPRGGMLEHPMNGNTSGLDYAQHEPAIIFRTGDGGASLSTDAGRTWTEVRSHHRDRAAAAVTADGAKLIESGLATAEVSSDHGKTWAAVAGLPGKTVVVTDRVDPSLAYALKDGTLFVSRDAGQSFSTSTSNLPRRGKLIASTAGAGDLWIAANGLWHATRGKNFARIDGVESAKDVAVGKAAPGTSDPTVFIAGTVGGKQAVFRSQDSGRHWVDVLDASHSFGWLPDAIAADPVVFGRVYLGTNGRGVLIGEPK